MNEKSPIAIAVRLILYYINVLVAGTVGSSLVYMVYRMCTDIVAGQRVLGFNFSYFMTGVFIFIPVILIASCVLTCMYLIRHSSHSWLPLTVYGILSICSWLFLLPINFTLQDRYEAHLAASTAPRSGSPLSAGYFRKVDGSLLYYAEVTEDDRGTGLFIDTSDGTEVVYTFSNMRLPPKREFSDVLIQNTVEMPVELAFMARGVRRLLFLAREAHRGGRESWFCFMSLGLALISVAGLRHFSKWRLINVLSLVCATLAILALNLWAMSPLGVNAVTVAVNGLSRKMPQVQFPFVVLCNVISFLILSVVGLLIDIKRKRSGDGGDAEALETPFDDGFGGVEDL